MGTASWLLAVPVLLLSTLRFYQVRTPAGALLVLPKFAAAATSLYLAMAGVLAAALGAAAGAYIPSALGLAGAVLSAGHAFRAGGARGDLAAAFGAGWSDRIPPALRGRLPRRRWSWLLPAGLVPVWHRDVEFWRLRGEDGQDRPLLCDVWEPAPGVPRSGLAFIYFHGSAWHFLDKDFGTRAFFRHLAGQGHVAVDVAYRLSPETDIYGMVGDVRRAVAWVRSRAADYGVDPARVVIGGGSAGAHLALLAAYLPNPDDPAAGPPETSARLAAFFPEDLAGADTSVAGVVSFYGPTDVRACFEHTGGRLFSAPARILRERPRSLAGRVLARLARPGRHPRFGDMSVLREGTEVFVRNTLGVEIAEVTDDLWSLVSPVAYARSSVPPTLLLQGAHDCLVPVEATREFHRGLAAAGARVVYVEYPETEHAFDLGVLRVALAAQNAVYHLDRFLALLTSR